MTTPWYHHTTSRRRTVRFAGLDSPSPTLQAARRPKVLPPTSLATPPQVHTGGVAAEVQRWTESTGWTHMVAQMDRCHPGLPHHPVARDAASQSPVSRRPVSESPRPTLSPSPHPTLSPSPHPIASPVSPSPGPTQQVSSLLF